MYSNCDLSDGQRKAGFFCRSMRCKKCPPFREARLNQKGEVKGMKITDFKVGDKICIDCWHNAEYWEVMPGYFLDENHNVVESCREEINSTDWQHWTPPEEKRKPKTWYRFEYKLKGDAPMSLSHWYMSLEHFYANHRNLGDDIEFDIEPRVYEERDF